MSTLGRGQLEIVRWTLAGASDPQGADGVGYAARQAYDRMAAAGWEQAAGDPFLPTHDYAYAAPQHGDAYRQTWGYDSEARTERAAVGAVCYSVKLPSDASHVSPALAFNVVGDRYVDSVCTGAEGETPTGVIACAIASASATPPAWAAILAAAATSGPLCTPEDLTKPPNDRAGVTASVELSPASVTNAEWIHVILRMGDYAEHRGAWIEGGAMLDLDSLAATWDAEVAPDATATETLVPLSPYESEDLTDANRSHSFLYFSHARNSKEVSLAVAGVAEAKAALARLFDAAGGGYGIVGAIHPDRTNLAGVEGERRSSDNALLSIDVFGSASWREGCTFGHHGRAATAISFDKALDVGGRFTLAVGVWRVSPPPYLFTTVPVAGGERTVLAVPKISAWPAPADALSLCRGRADSVSLDFYRSPDTETAYPLAFERLGYAEISSDLAAGARIALDRPLPLGEHTTIAVTILPIAVSAFDSGNWTGQYVAATDLGNFTLHFD